MTQPPYPPVPLHPYTPPTNEKEKEGMDRGHPARLDVPMPEMDQGHPARPDEPRFIEKQIPVAPGLTHQTVQDFFSDRWGEVVMVIRRSVDGLVWVMTKDSFPRENSGENPDQNPRRLYSLPTGGIRHDETITTALWRELEEETGFEAQPQRLLAVIRYVPVLASPDPQNVRPDNRWDIPTFVSYIFLLQEDTGARPVLNCEEKILDFKTVSPAELLSIARQWRGLSGSSDQCHDLIAWGTFRSLAHQTVGEILTEN